MYLILLKSLKMATTPVSSATTQTTTQTTPVTSTKNIKSTKQKLVPRNEFTPGHYVYKNVNVPKNYEGDHSQLFNDITNKFVNGRNLKLMHMGTTNWALVLDFDRDLTPGEQDVLETLVLPVNKSLLKQTSTTVREKYVSTPTDTAYQYTISTTFPNGLSTEQIRNEFKVFFVDQQVTFVSSAINSGIVTFTFLNALTNKQQTDMETKLFPAHKITNKDRVFGSDVNEKITTSNTNFVEVGNFIWFEINRAGSIVSAWTITGRNNQTISNHEVQVLQRDADVDTVLSTELTQNIITNDTSEFIIFLYKITGTPATYIKNVQIRCFTSVGCLLNSVYATENLVSEKKLGVNNVNKPTEKIKKMILETVLTTEPHMTRSNRPKGLRPLALLSRPKRFLPSDYQPKKPRSSTSDNNNRDNKRRRN